MVLLVRLFKNTWFNRFANKEGITNAELREAASRLEAGHVDANLGGSVFKVRIARPCEGKSGGYRIIVFFKDGERTFFVYGFAKSDRANINSRELKAYKEASKEYFLMTNEQLEKRIKNGQLIEL